MGRDMKTVNTALLILCAVIAAGASHAQQNCAPNMRQTTPTADFTDHGDGTLTHQPTGLMWKQCAEGLTGADCADGNASLFTWQAALQHAEAHDFADYEDWRLPNIKELFSLVEHRCHNPAINLTVFPNDPNSAIWSGSPSSNPTSFVFSWYIAFNLGHMFEGNRTNLLRVRLVRGGQ